MIPDTDVGTAQKDELRTKSTSSHDIITASLSASGDSRTGIQAVHDPSSKLVAVCVSANVLRNPQVALVKQNEFRDLFLAYMRDNAKNDLFRNPANSMPEQDQLCRTRISPHDGLEGSKTSAWTCCILLAPNYSRGRLSQHQS